jgi:hypothetical protein
MNPYPFFGLNHLTVPVVAISPEPPEETIAACWSRGHRNQTRRHGGNTGNARAYIICRVENKTLVQIVSHFVDRMTIAG